jgi:hypothetical protein
MGHGQKGKSTLRLLKRKTGSFEQNASADFLAKIALLDNILPDMPPLRCNKKL